MTARDSATIIIRLFDLIERPVERVFSIFSSSRNPDVYGPVLKAWTVVFNVTDDGRRIQWIGIPGDDEKTLDCERLVKSLATAHIAERFGENTGNLKAKVLPGINEVVVYIENPAWTGPDSDDDFLMKNGL